MGIESKIPVCIFYVDGKCTYRGVNTPELAETPRLPLSERLGIDYPGGNFSLSGKGKLVDPGLITEPLCKGRLYFGDTRGAYQKDNCSKYAKDKPETKLVY